MERKETGGRHVKNRREGEEVVGEIQPRRQELKTGESGFRKKKKEDRQDSSEG